MIGSSKKLLQAAAGAAAGGELLAIEDVFSTYLYTGNASTQTITNGIDLAGEGGMVWLKRRSGAEDHFLFDSGQAAVTYALRSNKGDASSNRVNSLTSFNSSGFSLGANDEVNNLNGTYASWTFRKAPRFFDVVTYTGTGSARTVSHDLGIVPGCIIVKRTDTTGDWQVYHRSNTANPETDYLVLNSTAATADSNTRWNDTAPTDSVFTVGTEATVNASGGTYVAYLFAHDPLGPSEDGSDGLIACGSFTTDGSGNATVDLGWEPQWVLVKPSSAAGNWRLIDNMRGWVNGGTNNRLFADSSGAESAFDDGNPTATGFQMKSAGASITYIYIAIRRGPMRQPESGTEVFDVTELSSPYGKSITTGWPVDMTLHSEVVSTGNRQIIDRLRGTGSSGPSVYLSTNATSAEATLSSYGYGYDNNTGYLNNLWGGADGVFWNFRRAPGFFDVVAYTGDGAFPNNVSHNLGVAPEMMIVKARSNTTDWEVYHTGLDATSPADYSIKLNDNAAALAITRWYFTEPTDSVFTLSGNNTNQSGTTYIAYLFATLPGISKVGSYTGNGSSQTIDCGFTSGARFILIKRTDSTGDWYVWDTARGIVTGDDPHLSLNTTAAEVTNDDSIDPDSSGFIVNQVSATNINVSSANYIFLAIA